MSGTGILNRLKLGPATAAELADFCGDHSGGIARTMSQLIAAGKAERIDGGSGRGSRAIYALRKDI